MVLTTALWTALVSALLLLGWTILEHFLKKGFPDRLISTVKREGVVITTRKDYESAKKGREHPELPVMVRNSVVFHRSSTPHWADKTLMTGDETMALRFIARFRPGHTYDLFIPHVSARYMPPDRQKAFFRRFTPEEAEAYLGAKENIFLRMWRRLVDLYQGGDINHTVIRFVLSGALLLSLIEVFVKLR